MKQKNNQTGSFVMLSVMGIVFIVLSVVILLFLGMAWEQMDFWKTKHLVFFLLCIGAFFIAAPTAIETLTEAVMIAQKKIQNE